MQFANLGKLNLKEKWFFVFSIIACLSVFLTAATVRFEWLLLPIALLFTYQLVSDFRPLFFLVWFLIPISTELDLPGGISLDFPDEPLVIIMMFTYLVYLIQQGKSLNLSFFRHPLTLLLLMHLSWIFLSMITSNIFIVSFKYFLSKIWYVTVFFFMSGHFIKQHKDQILLVKYVSTTLVFTVIYALIRHSIVGFSFVDVNKILEPFYRNHVNYACLLALFLPYIWYIIGCYEKGTFKRRLWIVIAVLLIIGIQFSYTRAAYVALFAAFGAYYVVKLKFIKPTLAIALVSIIILVFSLVRNNKYLDYAPDFNKAITQQNFDKLVEATYKMEDISTMERVYRWVAGAHMARVHPIVGFGPGNFYNFYKSYTISNFKTYVSDNPEKSSVHCYYLLMIIDQGYFGLLFFIVLLFGALIYGEKIYHKTINKIDKRFVMAAILSLIIIAILNLINDMIETDKVGAFFFLALAIIVNIDIKNRNALTAL